MVPRFGEIGTRPQQATPRISADLTRGVPRPPNLGVPMSHPYGQPQSPYSQGPQQPYGPPQAYGPQGPQGYGPPGYGPPGQVPPPGYGGPPPRKSNPGLIVGIVSAVVVLAVLGITGFVAPGFFLSDDGDSSASSGSGDNGSGGAAGQDAGGAQAVADSLISALVSHDTNTLNQLGCPDISAGALELIEYSGDVSTAQLSGEVRETGDRAEAPFTASAFDGSTGNFVAILAKRADGWCWQDLLYPEDLRGGPTG